ncbi:MAG: helicase-exonuclease AddAB subunit AddB [Lachnospiraceae bacterium]|nr:helicase-exonuclease AddAB subunit AddB [Lachnospiraceae bacterium]
MPLKFILGPSGSGKTYQLYKNVIHLSKEHPEENFIVLVPEQFTMQTQKDIVTMHDGHAIMNIDVLSFVRLSYRIFEETGAGMLPVLDDEGKNLILRKIAGNCEDELKMLKGNIRKLGYISEVKSVLSEFAQYDIGEEELDRVMENVGEESKLYYKLMDMKTLYTGFQQFLKERYISKEELLDVLNRVVCKSEILKNSTIVLDGFTGFTPVQNRLLGELMKHCKRVVITATIDPMEDPYRYDHPYQLFGLSKQMVTSVLELAKENRIEIEEPMELFDPVPYRFKHNPALAFLEGNLFRYRRKTYEQEQDAVHIHEAKNPTEEALAAAQKVRALMREEGYRCREIAVIVSDMETYADALKRAFETYDIPIFMDHKRSILLNSFVEYLRSLLGMAEANFTYESVFRFLRTDLAGFTHDEVDEMENYVIGMGIKGYKRWQEKWIRRLKDTKEEDLERLNHYRTRFVEKVDDFIFVLRQRRKTVKDITMALYEFMVRENLQERIADQEKYFLENGQLALAKEYAQIYRIVIELADKFVELLGDEPVSTSEYCKLLDAGLEEARVGVIPQSIDQVVVGDMERTRLKDIRALLFVGANDLFLPGNLMRTGLLSELDREVFKNEKLSLSPGGKERAYTQKYYLYMNLTKPSEKLDIFYSKVSSDGKNMRPAYLVKDLKKLYPKLAIIEEEEKSFKEREFTEKLGLAYLIKRMQEHTGTLDPLWCELYTWYKKHPKWKKSVETLLEAGYYHMPTDALTKQVARQLYGENFEDSISRMERFSVCAFAHFLTYGLKLKERPEYEFQSVDFGNVCHRALEFYSKKIEKNREKWTELQDEVRNRYIDEAVEEAITDYGNSVLYSSARNTYMVERIKRMMERTIWTLTEQLSRGDFAPSAYEVRFSNGKIDRIDTCEEEDKVYVKVIDYKTGSKSFDVVSLYHGLQLQLMVYMKAATEREQKIHPGKEIIPSGVFYYRIQDPLLDGKVMDKVANEPDEVKEEHRNKELLKTLLPDGLINMKANTLEHLEHGKNGESLAVPVKFNKNGSLSKTSKVASEEEFELLMEYAQKKVKETHQEIIEGNVLPVPYRQGTETGCDYCAYRHICGFDLKVPGYHYRDLSKISKEEAFQKMKAKCRSKEEQ